MAGSMIEVRTNGDTIPVYLSLPPAGSGPGVIVIQEWWGLVPHIRAVADRLAAQGYVAAAPDLYGGKATSEPDEAARLAMELRIDDAARDMATTVDALLALPETTGDQAGAIGFCLGGGLVLKLASIKPEVGPTVSYYGFPREGMTWDLTKLRGPVLFHAAEHDDFAPPEVVEQIRNDLERGGVSATFHRYPGTGHAFFNDDRPDVHHAEASELAWKRTLEFLRANLGQG
jgi:carboxymethylenebutenolidase